MSSGSFGWPGGDSPEQLAERVGEQRSRLRRMEAVALFEAEADYPASLRRLRRPPPVIFVRGKRSLLVSPAVSIVGARAASSRARQFADALARCLVTEGFTVVSGGAIGVDRAAHVGAIEGGGATVAVLGSALNRLYPERNLDLFTQIAAQGVLLSPFPLDTPPRRSHFPQRNELIAALCRLVVVVEAGPRSGALNTARWARELAVPTVAVPGSLGCQRLIARGVVATREPGEVMAVLKGEAPPNPAPNDLDRQEAHLLGLLQARADDADGLARRAGLPVARVAALLLRLELAGVVLMDGPTKYRATFQAR